MRKIIFLFAATLVFIGCNSTPKDILPTEKVEDVMLDLVKEEDLLKRAKIRIDTALAYYHNVSYPKICKKHNVTKESFEKSLKYYADNPEDKKFYQMVVNLKERLKK